MYPQWYWPISPAYWPLNYLPDFIAQIAEGDIATIVATVYGPNPTASTYGPNPNSTIFGPHNIGPLEANR